MPDTKTNANSTAVQDQILEAIRVSQEATINAYRTWAEATASVMPNLTELFVPSTSDNSGGFATKLWTSQRDFMVRAVEAVAPLSQAAPETARRAAAASDRATASPKS